MYNENLDADVQITAEEKIAAMIREMVNNSEDCTGKPDYTLTDEDCADLGRYILKQVLEEFRPDLTN